MLLVRTIASLLLQTNCYLLIDEDTKQAVVIDAPFGIADQIASELQLHQATLTHVLLTHGHFDHTMDAPTLKQRFDVPILIHDDDRGFATDPESQGIPFELLGISTETFQPDGRLESLQSICVGNVICQIITTPGHTPGGICLYSASENRLFTGDTLFAGSWGRTDYAGGNEEMLRHSLKQLSEFPADTVFFPGHGQSSTIGNERWLARISI